MSRLHTYCSHVVPYTRDAAALPDFASSFHTWTTSASVIRSSPPFHINTASSPLSFPRAPQTMSLSQPPSDDYFQFYSDDPVLLEAAEQFDPSGKTSGAPTSPALAASDPDVKPSSPDPSPTPRPGTIGGSPRSKDAASGARDKIAPIDATDVVAQPRSPGGGGLVSKSPKAADEGVEDDTTTPTEWDITPAKALPFEDAVLSHGLRPVTLEALSRAQIFGESLEGPTWWLDGELFDKFVLVVRVKRWAYADGSIHAVIVDDTRLFRAMWDDDSSLPALTDPVPKVGDLVMLTARIGFGPPGAGYPYASHYTAQHFLHVVMLSVHILAPRSDVARITADLQAYEHITGVFDISNACAAETKRLDVIEAFQMLDDDMHKAVPDHTSSVGRDIQRAVHRAPPSGACKIAVNISLFHRLTSRSQHAVRLNQIVADIGPPLTRAALFDPAAINKAIQGLLTREVLFQFDTYHSVSFRLANPHSIFRAAPGRPSRSDLHFSSSSPKSQGGS
ncbi:uncharacterized protein B0H18DRAFT_1080696 [Fomitopsis serialis]|uniref:uncharacterized protein n=1 Tax=Fomitopsis serialis TaxID=139415 RepID=UPI002008CA33|nr:uncharacterized protein B0H18DRAFT_1080696 [Neoantrodia serialis]KAH9904637.1 hypothetical protein B0H18DRAFT_1080696 [Neoantrodia serialis]